MGLNMIRPPAVMQPDERRPVTSPGKCRVTPNQHKYKEDHHTMKYFTNINTLDELKAAYRRLALKYHPDMGGSTEIMQEINNEHDALFEQLKRQHNASADEYHQTTETAEEFREILAVLLGLPGLTVELCGSWLWISGETRQHKDALKAAGCRWSSSKKMWYWRHPEDALGHYRGKRSMNEIRSKYGSQVFDADGRERTAYNRLGATA